MTHTHHFTRDTLLRSDESAVTEQATPFGHCGIKGPDIGNDCEPTCDRKKVNIFIMSHVIGQNVTTSISIFSRAFFKLQDTTQTDVNAKFTFPFDNRG